MLVDSHCHLNMPDFSEDLDTIISNARCNKIDGLLTICTELNELKELKLISKKDNNIWYSGGIHPNNIKNKIVNELDLLLKYASDKKFIAIGETGLDYFYKNPKKEIQKDSFIKHISFARVKFADYSAY